MGAGLWVIAGLLAAVTARLIPAGRSRRWIGELVAAVLAAALCGLGATALDFGGLRELDWRAGLFAFLGAFAAAGVFRLVTFFNRPSLQ